MIFLRNAALSAALLLFAAAPLAGQSPAVADLSWMAGCWRASQGGTVTDETWMAPEGGLMLGMARTVRAGRATGYEYLRLRSVDGALVLTAEPSGQAPTDFPASSVTSTLVRFENPTHDFPQKIEYHAVPPDSLVARVYGEVTSATPAFQLLYGRVGCPSR